MSAGYSQRSAADKLGVTAGSTLALIGADAGWALQALPHGVAVRRDLRGWRDVTVAFIRSAGQLERDADRFTRTLDDAVQLWIAWPRRAAGHTSDVTENLIRDVFLARGLVDVKVAAIDEDWSGLKLVRRREYRGG